MIKKSFKNIFVISLLLFLFLGIFNSYGQKQFETIKKEYLFLNDSIYYLKVQEKEKRIYPLINEIKKAKKLKLPEPEKSILDSIHDYTHLILAGEVFYQKGKLDSIPFYLNYLKNTSKNNYVIARFHIFNYWKNNLNLNYVEALRNLDEALTYLKKSNHPDSNSTILDVHFDMINVYTQFGDYESAKEVLNSLEKQLEKHKSIRGYTSKYIHFICSKAMLFSMDNKHEEAMKIIKVLDSSIMKSKKHYYWYYSTLIEVYNQNKQYSKIITTLDKRNELNLYKGLNNFDILTLFNLNIKENNLVEAKRILKKLDNYKPTNRFQRLLLYTHKADYFTKTKNYKKATVFLNLSRSLKDSINTNNTKVLKDIFSYKKEREKKLIQLEESDILNKVIIQENQKNYRNTAILVGIFILLLFMFYRYFTKKKKNSELALIKEKNQEIIALKNKYIENLSHELRTPITILMGYIELIKKHKIDQEKIVTYADKSIRSGENVIRYLNDFITLIKLEKNTLSRKKESKNLTNYLSETIGDFAPIASLQKIQLYYKTNLNENIEYSYDYNNLTKIINNLLTNALKFSYQNNAVYVSSLFSEKGLQLIVEDHGIGISKEELSEIFSRFYQAENQNSSGGFGIGLSLVNDLVSYLKGTIEVSSTENVGSIFEIFLPFKGLAIKNETKRDVLNFTLLNPVVEQSITYDDKPKILIVDDNIGIISYLRDLLSGNFICESVNNGKDALLELKKTKYDLVISDLHMPMMSGFELRKAIINDNELDETLPFIIVSAANLDENKFDELHIGIDDFILKPFKGEELIARVYNLLKNKEFRLNIEEDNNLDISFSSSFIKELKQKVLEHIDNPNYTIKDLADSFNYSQKQLSSFIKNNVGMTAVQFVLEIRLLKAYQFLQTKKYQTIMEVIYAVGLNSRSYFYKKFEERFGIKAADL